MAERGIDITRPVDKPCTDRPADIVITIGDQEVPSPVRGIRYLRWRPARLDGDRIECVRPIRDDIERRVRALLTELAVLPAE
jgi:hypothetical protein